MSLRRICMSFVLALFLVSTVIAATGAAAEGRGAPLRVTKTVKAIIDHWSPKNVTISTGDTVTWKAVRGNHTITAYGGNWTFNHHLRHGDTEDRTFGTAGTFLFRCRIHSTLTNGHCEGMCGKVVVRS
jgi:plastocyanin